jgi:hypothetical protein
MKSYIDKYLNFHQSVSLINNIVFFISDPSSDLEVTVSLADISGTRADAGSDMKKVHVLISI